MFDGALPEIADLAGLSHAEVVEGAGRWARAENAACARKLAFMGEMFARRTGLAAGERELWWVDPQAAVTAEMAAAVNISESMALHQTHRGVALRDRLPAVGALFEAGLITDVLVRAIVWRTYLIADEAAMAAVDAALAQQITGWGALSIAKTEAAIDALVDQHDPGALRRSRESASSPTVEFGSPADPAGTTSMWARLYAPDAALIEQRVEEMAHRVCEADPRSMSHRRADALTALAAGIELACACNQPDCVARPRQDRSTANAVVYVVADQTSVHTARTDTPLTDEATGAAGRAVEARCAAPPAYVLGGGILPTALLDPILVRARLRAVRHPGHTSPEPRYAPSRSLAAFIRCRDLTCRFPGCDKPAQFCDIDHTVAYPPGPTHPSNLKCLCRFHHLLKTFWNGRGGWHDRQLPDGTIIWTAPTGHTYFTYPGAKHLFPPLCEPTTTLWTGEPPVIEPSGDRGVMMPRRRRTRAEYIAKAKAAERQLNDFHVAERNRPPPF